MIDFSAVTEIRLPEGTVKQLEINGTVAWKSGPTNMVPTSINADGSIYNNGLGYKTGYRIRSGGVEAAEPSTTCTGFIPVNPGDTIWIKGWLRKTSAASNNNINVADANFTNIGQVAGNGDYGIFADAYAAYGGKSVVDYDNMVSKWVVPPAASGVKYIRVCGGSDSPGGPGADLIVTINEELEH